MASPQLGLESTNYLGLFDDKGDPIVSRMTKFLSLSQKQLADAFGLSIDQIRPERMSEMAIQRVRDLAGILEFVARIFKGDEKKTLFWIKTPNPHFGRSRSKRIDHSRSSK